MNLTDEEIRIKAAEAMGWKWNTSTDIGGKAFPECWIHDDHGFAWHIVDLPNYPADLNACAEFEKSLTEEEHLRYRVRLWNVVITEGDETTWDRQFISATARQRCIAFLKTKGIIP